jgi:hypothetical protein
LVIRDTVSSPDPQKPDSLTQIEKIRHTLKKSGKKYSCLVASSSGIYWFGTYLSKPDYRDFGFEKLATLSGHMWSILSYGYEMNIISKSQQLKFLPNSVRYSSLTSRLRHTETYHKQWSSLLFLTHLLTPWSRVLPEKLKRPKLLKKFPAFYGTRKFITVFTAVQHLSLSWARLIQSMPPHPTSRRFILILSSHLRLSLPSGLLPSGFMFSYNKYIN